MSIQEKTYKLCKDIQKSQHREPIKNLIQALSLNNDAIIFRQTVRHISRYPKLQFLAYLIVGQQKEGIDHKIKQQMPVLENDELHLLVDCHEHLLKLNKLCVSSILDKIPKLESAISPFNVANYYKQTTDQDFVLFDSHVANELVSAFHNHPAIELIFETYEGLEENIDEEHYFTDVANFSQEIVESSPFKSPEWLANSRKTSKNNHLKHMLALVSIRDTLSNINQLIFQATTEIEDKLLIFDDENIINLSSTYNNEVSSSLRVTCLTSAFRFLIAVEPLIFNSGTLVLLKEVYGYKGVQLGRVEGRSADLISDCAEFDIRLIDENLNSFPHLLKRD